VVTEKPVEGGYRTHYIRPSLRLHTLSKDMKLDFLNETLDAFQAEVPEDSRASAEPLINNFAFEA